MSSPPSSSMNSTQSSLKTYFKTPEGRYKLQYEKTHPSSLIHYAHGKVVSQLTIVYLKEKPALQQPTTPTTPSSSSGVRSAAARFLGASNGSRALSFVGGNGTSKAVSSNSRIGGSVGSSGSNAISNYDGKGTYLIFNSGDSIFISDLNSQDKDPIKVIHFSNSNPICHAFDPEAKDGHDLLIGLHSGDVYSVSLRQQLQDVGKKLVGAQHYNKDGVINNSRCTCVAWVPEGDGAFVAAHADGNLYVYEKSKEGTADCSFPGVKDPTQFSVLHARSSKSNPIARWHVCQGSINNISFSNDGTYLATVGRDGYLRVFDYSKEQLVCGGKSYHGALLCCSWSSDGTYILAGGEDDLVLVWSMEDRKIVAWGEGHNSWVSGVAFDSYWQAPSSDETEENVMYRFGSVGQMHHHYLSDEVPTHRTSNWVLDFWVRDAIEHQLDDDMDMDEMYLKEKLTSNRVDESSFRDDVDNVLLTWTMKGTLLAIVKVVIHLIGAGHSMHVVTVLQSLCLPVRSNLQIFIFARIFFPFSREEQCKLML